MRVNDNLKKLRMEQGYTPEQFAEALGTDEETVRRIEAGEEDVPASLIYAAAKQAGTTASWLMDGTGSALQNERYEVNLRIYGKQDRATVAAILIMNGYDVGQHKVKRTATGKSIDYFLHANLLDTNTESPK